MLYTYMSQVGFHETRGASNRSMHTLSPTTGLPCMSGWALWPDLYCKPNKILVHVYAKDWVAANRNWNLQVGGWENRQLMADATKQTAHHRSHELFPGLQESVRKTFPTYNVCVTQPVENNTLFHSKPHFWIKTAWLLTSTAKELLSASNKLMF